MNRVHIIMASYNGEKYIKEQIESIISNTYSDWTLTIFDDGSKDATCQIVTEYEVAYPNKIKLIKNQQNKGVTKNFLTGVCQIQVDERHNNYYMFCDQDDVWMKDKIENTLKSMKKLEGRYNNCPLVVFSDTTVVDEHLTVTEPSFFKNSGLEPRHTKLNDLLIENKLIGCTVMFNEEVRRKLVSLPQQQAFPKEIRFHDWWIGLIASSFGHIYYMDRPTLYYRQHGNNVVGNKSFFEYVKKSFLSLSKQKKALEETILQGKAFLELYGDELSIEKKEIVSHFSKLSSYGFVKKRRVLLKYRFSKTGILRNVGVFLLI